MALEKLHHARLMVLPIHRPETTEVIGYDPHAAGRRVDLFKPEDLSGHCVCSCQLDAEYGGSLRPIWRFSDVVMPVVTMSENR
jgi:hypothetical protein